MKDIKPLHKSDVLLKDLGRETLIYSARKKEMHILNPSARLIWNLCDGQHSLGDIELALRKQFSISDGRDVRGDILATLDIFQEKELLDDGVIDDGIINE
jgi:hypothetical protein